MSSRTGHPLHVLLVESSSAEARHIADCLRSRLGPGSNIAIESTIESALQYMSDHVVDVIVLELNVDGAAGTSAFLRLRVASQSMPVVVYTRLDTDGFALLLLRDGAQECLSKHDTPPEKLAQILHFAVERQQRMMLLERARVEAAHRATHDPLTGLANRDLFLDHFKRALSLSRRYGRKTAILFLDLDGFKAINDTYGHTRGDVVLRTVAERLLESVRHSDAVARLSGDEFIVLLRDVTSRRDIIHVRNSIMSAIRQPIDVGDGQRLTIEGSAGSAMAPLDGVHAAELLDVADADMYRDKIQRQRDRQATPAIAVPAIGVSAENALMVSNTTTGSSRHTHMPHRREARMRQALLGGEFEVWFQPVVDAARGRVVSADAQLRWRNPDRGIMLPASFMRLAEDTGLIVPMGDLLLRAACEKLARCLTHPEGQAMQMSVRVSTVQLRERDFISNLSALLQANAIPANALVLELGEDSVLIDGELAVDKLVGLKAIGVQLYIVDIGDGTNSLTVLRNAPVDGIRIHERFVRPMMTDRRDAAIVDALIRLGHGLGVAVVANGVDTLGHATALQDMHCVRQQGHYHGEAGPGEALDMFFRVGRQIATPIAQRTKPRTVSFRFGAL